MSTHQDFITFITDFDERISHLDTIQVVSEALHFIADRMNLLRSSIALLEPDRSGFRMRDVTLDVKDLEKGRFVPFTDTYPCEIVQTKRPGYRPDIRKHAAKYKVDAKLVAAGLRSDYVVPLIVGDQCIGTLNSGSSKVDGISERDRQLLVVLAPRLAQALRNANLYEDLRESERKFRELFHSANDGIYLWRLEDDGTPGRCLEVNDVACRLLGYSRDEFLTMMVRDIDAEESAPQTSRVMKELLTQGRATFEMVHVSKDGRRIPVEISSHVFTLTGQRVILSIARDITERKRAEETLRESEERFRNVFKSSAVGIALVGPDNRFIEVNPKLCQMLGYEEQELKPLTFLDITHPDDVEASKEAMQRLRQGGAPPVEIEKRYVKKDGDILWGITTVSSIQSAADKSTYQLGMVVDITERVRAEAEIKRLKEFNEGIVQSMAEGIVVEDKRGYFTFVNSAAAALLGYIPEELVGQHWTAVVPPDHQPIVETADERRVRGEFDHYEIEALRKDGSRVHVLISGSPRFEDGRFIGTMAVFTDITERVRAEAALRESEQRMELVLRGADLGTWDWNVVTGELTFNERWAEMLGYGLNEIEPRVSTWEKLVHPDDMPDVMEILNSHLGGKTDFYETEHRVKHKSGDWVWILDKGRVIERDADGKPLRACGTHLHITERKQAEEELQKSEEKYRDLVENLNDVIYTVDNNGMITYVSPAIEPFLGYRPSEIIGRPFATLIYQQDLQRIRDGLGRLLTGGSPEPSEYRILTKSGEIRWMRTFSRPIFEQDRVVGLQGVLTDITERVRTEEELKQYRDHLEELVEERTRELKEAQAELLRKERLSALGQLTATVAHEIRNPLGTVRTAVFAIGDAIERDELHRVERARQLAERNVVRCDRIITELLDYTRERALNLEPVYVDVWLDALLDEQGIPESIVCARNLDAGAQVPIDREHLRRAVINVVENAIHALQEEGAAGNRLTVSTRAVAGRLEIKVSDTGPGIPAELMGKIFEPLFSTKTYGVGLGMSIVKNIMQQHGGGIEFESRIGRGTAVTLWLPIQNKKE